MKMILLMKDNSIRYNEEISPIYKDIQFILLKCDEELNTYVLIEPNPYMVKMKKAKIIIESVFQINGSDGIEYNLPMGRIEKTIYDYVDLIQYLFSIEKTKFYNEVMMMSEYTDDIPSYMVLKYCFFSIKVYGEHNKILYKKKIDKSEEVALSEIYISELFGPRKITNSLEELYFTELSLFKEHISIDPINKKWNIGHLDYLYDLCALWLDETNSISFFPKKIINKFKHINTLCAMSCTISTVKSEGTDCRSEDIIPRYDLIYVEPQLIIEYIIYLSYINLILRACAKIANDHNHNGELKEYDYTSEITIELEIKLKSYNFNFNDMNVITIEDVIDLLERS